MKKSAIILCVLAVFGCRTKQTKGDAATLNSPLHPDVGTSVEVIDTPTEAVDGQCVHIDTTLVVPDSTYVCHKWHDRGHLFGSPTASRRKQWKKKCEENSDGQYSNEYIRSYKSTEQMLAVLDFSELFFHTEDEYITPDDDFFLWRISEYMPMSHEQPDEYTRFKKLDIQIDSLLDYETKYMIDYYVQSDIKFSLLKTRANVMYRRLLNWADSSIVPMLKKENRAFWRYRDVQRACFDTVWRGPDCPTAYGMAEDELLMRQKSLEPFYFFVADGDSTGVRFEKHVKISMRTINDEYDKFIAELPADDADTLHPVFPITARQKCLRDERRAFGRWMSERKKISDALTGAAKARFDQATNNARRDKLFMLKNRYEGYGIGSETYFRNLLQRDCTDKQLMEYHIPENLYL